MSEHAAKPSVDLNLEERLEKSHSLLSFTDISRNNDLGGIIQGGGGKEQML